MYIRIEKSNFHIISYHISTLHPTFLTDLGTKFMESLAPLKNIWLRPMNPERENNSQQQFPLVVTLTI
jgi:hypothetical protein